MNPVGRLIRTCLFPNKAIVLFCLILLALVWAAVLGQIAYDREITTEGIRSDGDKFSRAFEEHVRTVLISNEQYLLFMQDAYERSNAVTPALDRLFAQLRRNPLIIQAAIVDSAGNFLIAALPGSSGINIADVPHFTAHVAADSGKTYIGKPFTGRVSNQVTIHLSRRLNNPDGSFAGVAIIAIDPFYFSRFFQNMAFDEHYTVRLVGQDGVIRASNLREEVGYDFSPAELFAQAARAPSGFYFAPGTRFGKSGLTSYRAMPDYPLIVQVGLAEKALLPLAQRRTIYLSAAGGVSLFLVVYTGMLLRRAHKQWLAEIELQNSYYQLSAVNEELTANEEELRASYSALVNERAFSSAVLESVPGLLYLYDAEGRLVRWNKNHETATGYSAKELAGMKLSDWYLGDAETAERITREVAKAFDHGVAYAEADLRNKAGDKTTYYFTAVKTMIDNKPYIVGIGIDITDRKRLESDLVAKEQVLQRSLAELTASHEELSASEEELRTLYESAQQTAATLAEKEQELREILEHMHDAFALHEIICDDEGRPVDWRYLFVNEAYERMCGRKRANILGRTASEATPEILTPEWLEANGQVALTGVSIQATNYLAVTGRYYSVSIYCPERRKFVIMAMDITEQKEGEDRLRHKEEQLQKSYRRLSNLYEEVVAANEKLEHSRRTAEEIFNAAGDGFVVCDGETGDILAVNRRMTEIFGYSKEEFVKQGIALIAAPANLETAFAMLRKAATGGPQPLFERETADRDGRRLVIEISATPVTIDGKARCLALMRDVTVRKQLEEGLAFLRMMDSLTGVYNRAYFEADMLRMEADGHGGLGIFVCDVDGLKLINDTLGHRQGDELLKSVAALLAAGVQKPHYVARIGGDEFAVIVAAPTREQLEELDQDYRRRVAAYNEANPHLPLSLSLGWAMGRSDEGAENVFKEADNNMYRQKMHQSQSVRGSIVQTMMKAMEERDHITEGHADRLGDLMERLGHQLQLPQATIADLRLLAKFHDIGKVGIPDSILNKPGRLSEEEMAIMRRHCEIGFRIAKASPDLGPIADWILKHQEWWNGQGYPLGLAGEEIPLECRILGIADAFDAMTNDRPYRKAMAPSAAVAELRRCAGTQFDPHLVELFIAQVRATF